MSQLLDDLQVLELTVQDPDKADNTGPEQMKKVIAQSPADLTEIDEVVVDLSLAKDKTLQGASLVSESFDIKKRGKIGASEVMALEELAGGIVNAENPIGLYTDVPTGANLQETVKRVGDRGNVLMAEGASASQELNTTLIKLLNKLGSDGMTLVEKIHQDNVSAVSAYVTAHGFLPVDFQRKMKEGNELPLGDASLNIHAVSLNPESPPVDALAKFVTVLIENKLASPSSKALQDAITCQPKLMVDGVVYDLESVARGEGVLYTGGEVCEEVPVNQMLSSVVGQAGSGTTVNYARLLCGAMLGLATYLGNLKAPQDDATKDLNAAREFAFKSLSAATLGQVLQKRFDRTVSLITGVTVLYNELALTKEPAKVPAPAVEKTSVRYILGRR